MSKWQRYKKNVKALLLNRLKGGFEPPGQLKNGWKIVLASYWQDLCLSTFIKCHCTTTYFKATCSTRRFSRRINSALKCHNGIKGCRRRQDENVKHSFIMSKIPSMKRQQFERSELLGNVLRMHFSLSICLSKQFTA